MSEGFAILRARESVDAFRLVDARLDLPEEDFFLVVFLVAIGLDLHD